jgi:hypothetical protein
MNVYLRLQLTCLLLSAICCYRLCLFRVLLDACPFYFLQYTALPTFCNCRLFCMRSSPLPLCGTFHTTAAVISFPLSKVAGQVWPLLPSLASLFIYSLPEGLPLPHSLGLGHPALFAMCLFFFCCLFIIQFVFFSLYFFPLGGSLSVQGAVLIWPRVVCGSTLCHLAHLVLCIFPSILGAGISQCRSPPGFSV